MGVKNILMLSSYLDAVRITIIKEIEQDIEGIRRFDKLFSREKKPTFDRRTSLTF